MVVPPEGSKLECVGGVIYLKRLIKADGKSGKGTAIYQSYPIKSESILHSIGIFKQSDSE